MPSLPQLHINGAYAFKLKSLTGNDIIKMMTFVNPEFVERYQVMFEKDPKSKVFAPLAEAYRKMGLLDEALEVCRKGVEIHPHFPSGRVALAKVLIDKEQLPEAVQQLRYAAELSPENLLAHSLMGEIYLKLRRPKDALKAYKMVLFLNPNDTKASSAVRKLESLTADEYDSELFTPTQLVQIPPQPNETNDKMRVLERYLSLVDAFIVRSDLSKAWEALQNAQKEIGSHPELERRRALITEREDQEPEPLAPVKAASSTREQRKKEKLQSLLQRINERRFEG